MRGLACDDVFIDDEAVVFLDDGWSDFRALLTTRGGMPAALVAFDLARLMATICQRPLEARREALQRLVARRRGDGRAALDSTKGCPLSRARYTNQATAEVAL